MRRLIKINKQGIKKEDNGFMYRNGYMVDVEGRYIHRLVSEHTDGKIPKRYVVHHCDYDKTNNNIDNLVQIPEEVHVYIHKHKIKPSKKEILDKILLDFKNNQVLMRIRNLQKKVRDLENNKRSMLSEIEKLKIQLT